jgi:hypothetical protein
MKEERDPDLAALLAAAAAPGPGPDGDERGLEAILAAYRAAVDAPVRETHMMSTVELEPVEAPAAGRGRASQGHRRFTRAVAVKFAAVLVAFAGTGVAVASAGMLPTPIQRFAHTYFGGVGIPGPNGIAPTTAGSVTPLSTASRSGRATAGPESSGTASASASPVQATPAELAALCEIVVEAGDSWRSDLDKAQRDLLVATAGGNSNVVTYCNQLVAGGSPSASAPAPGTTPTPSPGDGNGNGGGNGNGKGHASKSPKADPTK